MCRRNWINYQELETEDEPVFNDGVADNGENWKNSLITPRRRSKRWKLTVGAVVILAIVGLTVGIVIWQTKDADSKSPLNPPPTTDPSFQHFTEAAITCDAPYCADIGKSMLEKNGTVADAAIATLLCMGVVHSQSMGIGGGFLMVMYKDGHAQVLNARERAPGLATEDMFKGNQSSAQRGGLSVAVPGEIKGYWRLWKEAGRLPWKDLFTPTVELCRNGFNVTGHTSRALLEQREGILAEPSMSDIFVDAGTGTVYKEGDTIYRRKLADTLERIGNAEDGAKEFYEGETGRMLVEDLQSFGGIITMQDLKDYDVEWVDPLKVRLSGGLSLYSVPPPGSGLLMSFIMKILDTYNLSPSSIQGEKNILTTYQLITEAFKHAYAQRTHLGDPSDSNVTEIVQNLIYRLTSDAFVEEIRQKISPVETNNTYEYYGAELYAPDDHGTAHVSIVGPNGDAISVTSTINLYYGARIRSVQTGIIYNDEMDDFSAPNITNFFGVPPSVNNFIVPGKIPLSSMTPAIFTDGNGKVRLVVGSAGGTKITSATALVAVRNLWLGQNVNEAINGERFHHQLFPMEFGYETGFPESILEGMRGFGHNTTEFAPGSSVTSAVSVENGIVYAKTDLRKDSSLAGF